MPDFFVFTLLSAVMIMGALTATAFAGAAWVYSSTLRHTYVAAGIAAVLWTAGAVLS